MRCKLPLFAALENMTLPLLISSERTVEEAQIRDINVEAFGKGAEANHIDTLRRSHVSLISLVAEVCRVLVGHVLFSPVSRPGADPSIQIAGLGPMAV